MSNLFYAFIKLLSCNWKKGNAMDINEIAKDTYYFSINNNLNGFITERNAIKCFDQLV